MRCQWCANPESQHIEIQAAYQKSKCIKCTGCLRSLPEGVVMQDNNKYIKILNHQAVVQNFSDKVCPAGALKLLGELKSVGEIIKIVEADTLVYGNSGGGMTLSGGEPLLQADFAVTLLREAQARYINCAIETCGYIPWISIEKASEYLDYILFDLKSMDDEKHRIYTGVSNQTILENFAKLCKIFPNNQIHVRTPVIPGFNDSEEEIAKIAEFLDKYPEVRYELLPYHRLGQQKYESLGIQYLMGDVTLDEKIMIRLKEIVGRRKYV